MPTAARAALHPEQLSQMNAFHPVSDSGDATNGVVKAGTGWVPVSLMSDSIGPKNTNVMHVAFPVSKGAVRNFRGELEDNIEFKVKPNGSVRLRDLLIPGHSGFNGQSPFPIPRGFEQPIIKGKYGGSSLLMDDLVSSPINAEANPAPSPIPL